MGDSFEVRPDTVRAASVQWYEGSDAVGDAAALLALTGLNPDSLGDVAAAAEFSTALQKFTADHGDDLRHGSVWVNNGADGLLSSAEAYQANEEVCAAELRKIEGAQ